MTLVPFSDLARAAYCPRQLYYVRRDDERSVPPKASERIDLAFRYEELADAPERALRQLPLHRSPSAYRRNLRRLRERDEYEALVDPATERGFLSGKDCHGTVHKVLELGEEATDSDGADSATAIPTLVSSGEPPENGVWGPQAVRAVGLAKALAWEREREVDRALVEYPAVGVVRE
ncbi:hypothetical protein EXE43_21555, partial [Halorubrum sp. SS5]